MGGLDPIEFFWYNHLDFRVVVGTFGNTKHVHEFSLNVALIGYAKYDRKYYMSNTSISQENRIKGLIMKTIIR